MALHSSLRRGQQDPDPRDAELARLNNELLAAHMQLAGVDERLGREAERADDAEQAATEARKALGDIAYEVADKLLPTLPAGLFADDPMPPDAACDDNPICGDLYGSWEPVDGDRYDLPPRIAPGVPPDGFDWLGDERMPDRAALMGAQA